MTRSKDHTSKGNAVLTGGAGFIGYHLARRLLKDGWKVSIIDNFDPFYDPKIKRRHIGVLEKEFSPKVRFHSLDICNAQTLQPVFEKDEHDVVFHLAALAGVRPSIEKPYRYHEVNVGGTLNLLQASKNAGIRNFIFGSSSSVYGGNQKTPFSETDDVSRPISPYAATKKAGELYCHTFHHLYEMNIAALRFFTVYGPGQRPDLAIHKFTKLLLAETEIPFFGDGSSRRDYTYVDDIVDGVVQAQGFLETRKRPVFEIFNLGNSNPISLLELVHHLENTIGKKAKLKRLPNQPGDMNVTYADISKSKEILSYNPRTSITTGLSKFVSWYKETIACNG